LTIITRTIIQQHKVWFIGFVAARIYEVLLHFGGLWFIGTSSSFEMRTEGVRGELEGSLHFIKQMTRCDYTGEGSSKGLLPLLMFINKSSKLCAFQILKTIYR
jgi:hypothetical protein